MGRVRVVTDTTHYLPRPIVAQAGIALVSLYVNWDGRTDRESDLANFHDYYAHLGTAKELPTTSQPSVGDFLAVYEPIVEAGDDIVSLHLSGGISGTVRSAEQARESLVERGVAPERVLVVDSETACGGLGLVAMAAAAAADRGADTAAVAAAARALRADLRTWFAVDTPEFLRRGGGHGSAQGYLGAGLENKTNPPPGKE